MIGLQKIIIDQNYKVADLAKEVGKSPAVVYNWFRKNRVSDKYLDFLADKFNVSKEYLNEKVNDIDTYQPRKKGFNEHKTEGDITTVYIERKNGKKYEFIIDTEDLNKINKYCWHVDKFSGLSKNCYVRTTIYQSFDNGKKIQEMKLLHSLILGVGRGVVIDHINHDTLDNRKGNLRVVPQLYNTKNRSGKNSNNKSGYRNVCWIKTMNKWCVQIMVNGENTRLGYFDDIHEAGKFAEEMRKKYYGKYAGKS